MDNKTQNIVQKLSTHKVDFSLMERMKTSIDKMILAATSAARQIDSAISDIERAEATAKQVIDIAEAGIQSAKDLGADSIVAKGEKAKQGAEILLSNYRKGVTQLKEIRKEITA